eukprot:4756325-Amphidinium_carterae.1
MFPAWQQEESGQQQEVPKMVALAPQGMGLRFWEVPRIHVDVGYVWVDHLPSVARGGQQKTQLQLPTLI